ncbi:metal-dependent hydrolase [Daejeonia sp. YH14]|uniref:metal-dependent hydrolase n=1 Tax=Daejeonia sp. YH14 TaxID=3439042 RepID=UPI003F494560
MKIKFLGQNCFLFSYQGINILSDPFYNFQKEKSGFDLLAQPIDYLLITHAHGDHIADVKEVMEAHPDVTVVGQPEICAYFGHPHSVDLNFGGTLTTGSLKITMVTALHTSSFPDGSYGGQPAGYILRYDGKIIYLAGDTGLISDMAMIRQVFGEVTAAVLPVGAHYTMCARQASFAAAELIKTSKVIGCHFDTFPPITIDHEWAKQQFANRNIDFSLPELGEEFEI